jgi:hypothetical protein
MKVRRTVFPSVHGESRADKRNDTMRFPMNSEPILSWRIKWVLIWAITLALGCRLYAIDPLPPDIQSASEKVKTAYREQMAQRSLREKIAVGKQRHEDRMRYKQQLSGFLRREAEARIETIRNEVQFEQERQQLKSTRYWAFSMLMLACAMMLATATILLKRRLFS